MNDTDTPAGLRGLIAKATPGPIELHTSNSWRRIVTREGRPWLVPCTDPDGHANMDSEDNAALAVAAVNALPALLDERDELVRKLAEATDRIRAAIDASQGEGWGVGDLFTAAQLSCGLAASVRTVKYQAERITELESALAEGKCTDKDSGADLCEVAAAIEVVRAREAIYDAAAVVENFAEPFRSGFLSGCEEIAYRLDIPFPLSPLVAPLAGPEATCDKESGDG